MRKHAISLLLGLCAVCAVPAAAQQNLFVAQDIESPVVHEDNTVTFSLIAPDAEKVQIAGDFADKAEAQHVNGMVGAGLIEMTKGEDGTWTYTTSPLPSELYSYEFIVDGVPTIDPNNVYVYRDFATITNVFLVGNGQADIYKVNDVPHGSLHTPWYHSEGIGTDRRLNVYTPAEYEANPDKSYPALYLLHGSGGDENEWVTFGRTCQIMDNLIASGEAEPMIVVMPNGHGPMTAAPGESHLGYYKPHYLRDSSGSGSFESNFGEIIEFTEKTYRVKADKAHRAIAGLSMGGGHAATISCNNPDLFDYVGVFSAALAVNRPNPAGAEVYNNIEAKLDAQFAAAPKLYWIGVGVDDMLYERTAEFRSLLDSKGYKYVYLESPGAHVWTCWRIYLADFAARLFAE